jgi:thioredoxin 1
MVFVFYNSVKELFVVIVHLCTSLDAGYMIKSGTLLGLWIVFGFFAAKAQDNFVVSADEFRTLRERHPEWQLVDVRTGQEFSNDRINGALNVDFNAPAFRDQVKTLDKSVPVLVYCLSGGRSAKAAAYMRDQGFNVYELKGGLMKWKSREFPLESMRPVAKGLSLAEYNEQTSGKLVLVDFYATWCAPCRKMSPQLEALSVEHKGKFSLIKINVDENTTVVKALKVDALPVLMLYKDGTVIWSANEFVEKEDLSKVLKEHF